MSMDCHSLVTLLLPISFISWSKVQTRVEDVSSVISIGVLRSVDRRVSILVGLTMTDFDFVSFRRDCVKLRYG